MNLQLAQDWIDASFRWTWRTGLEASLLFALVWLIQAALGKRLEVRTRYWLSLLAFLRLLLPAAPESRASLFNIFAGVSNPLAVASPLASHQSDRGPLQIDGRLSAEGTVAKAGESHLLNTTALSQSRTVQNPAGRATGSWLPEAKFLLELTWLFGAGAMLFLTLRQHWAFSRWADAQEPVTDPEMLTLWSESQRLMGVKRKVRLLQANCETGPFLFGWRSPRLILPQAGCLRLKAAALRSVFLHELAHVKRQDISLNWLMIVVRAVHWFNPVAWILLRRLRADRELVCDAMALRLIETKEHRLYGETLLQMLEVISGRKASAAVVRAFNNKQEIERRITMICRFKRNATFWVVLGPILVGALCLLTFTRAADPNEPFAGSAPRRDNSSAPKRRGAESTRLRDRLVFLEERLRQAEEKVDQLRRELSIPSSLASADSFVLLDPETVRALERERIGASARAAQYSELLDRLTALRTNSTAELAQAIPTAVPDTELSRLLADLNQAETQKAWTGRELGGGHPQVQNLDAKIRTLREQVDNRIEGVLSGLGAQIAAQKATAESIKTQVIDRKKTEVELSKQYRPYFRAKHDLQLVEKMRDEAMVKVLESEMPDTQEPARQAPR